MTPGDVVALVVLLVVGTLVASGLLFGLRQVSVPVFPSERPSAVTGVVPAPVPLPVVGR